MNLAFLVCVGLLVVFLLVWTLWRLSSRRSSLPCPSWLAWLVELDNPLAKNNNASVIAGLLDLQPGMCVLDAGCGPGRVTIRLAEQVGPNGVVVAVDLQQDMIRRAQDKVRAAGLTNVQFLQQGIGEGMLAAERFDRIVLVTVLGEVPDRAAAMKELAHALKPGGILSVTETLFDPHYQRRTALLDLAGEAGLREKSFFGNRLSFTVHLEKPRA